MGALHGEDLVIMTLIDAGEDSCFTVSLKPSPVLSEVLASASKTEMYKKQHEWNACASIQIKNPL